LLELALNERNLNTGSAANLQGVSGKQSASFLKSIAKGMKEFQ
jgi:hypothetical protein